MKVRELKRERTDLIALNAELVAALRAVLPYAEQESQGLWACVRDDHAIADEADAAESAIASAYSILARSQS